MNLLSLSLFLFVIVSASFFLFYFSIRNNKVAEFRMEIIEYIYRKQVEIPFADLKEYTKSIDKNNYDEKELVAICNGVRWVLILVACIPIINILALYTESCIIAYQIKEEEIQVRGGDESKFLKWWRK